MIEYLVHQIFRGTRWEQSVISGGCFISRESWKRSRGKTRFADTCHEHRWSSPSLTSHFQPISRISSTFRVALVIARFHAPSGLIGTDVLRGDRIKQKLARSRSTGRPIMKLFKCYNIYCAFIYSNVNHAYSWELFSVCLTLSRFCRILIAFRVRNLNKWILYNIINMTHDNLDIFIFLIELVD